MFSHIQSFHFTSQHKSSSLYSEHVLALSAPHSPNTQCVCLLGALSYGNVIVSCRAARAGPFSGSVVGGCSLLSTTSKVPCPSGSFYFTTRLVQKEACREDQPFSSQLPHDVSSKLSLLGITARGNHVHVQLLHAPPTAELQTDNILHDCSKTDSAAYWMSLHLAIYVQCQLSLSMQEEVCPSCVEVESEGGNRT